MAMSQRISCVCVALLLVGGLVSLPVTAASPVEELTRVLPDDLLFFVATSGTDAAKADFDQSILGRIWNDPSMQSFATAIRTEVTGTILREAGSDDFARTVGVVLDQAQLVLRRPAVVGLARVEVEEMPPACLFAILDAGDRKADLEAAVAKVETMLGDVVIETTIGSFKMHTWENEDDLPLYWGWVGNTLVVAANDAHGAVVKYVSKPRQTAPPYLDKVPEHGDVLAVYYDYPKLLGVVDDMVAEEGGRKEYGVVKAVLADLGFANLGTMITRAGFVGPDLVTGAYVQVPQPRTGLFATFGPVDPSAFALVDAQAVTATAFNWDLAAVYDTVMKAIETASPDEVYPGVQEGLAQFEAQAQFRLRDGLLKSLAGPVTFYALPAGKMLEAPMGGFVAVAKLADSPLFEETVTALGEFADAEAEGVLQVGSQTDEAGRTLHVWASPMLAFAQLMPTWCVVEGQVVVGSNTAVCKRGIAQIVARGQGTKSLLDTDGYRKVAARFAQGILSLTYIDSQVQFQQMLMQMQQVWPMAVMAAMRAGVKLPVMLPSLGQVGQDMQPACEYSYAKPDGLYSHYQGPGVEVSVESVAVGALGMGVLMPALGRTRQLSFRMTSGTNLSGIGKACLIYANDHQDELPPDLETLVEEVELSPKSLESMRKPDDFDGPSYIYIAGQTTSMSPGNIVAYENPEFCLEGVNVLFLDSHVQFMKPDKFREALKATYKRLGRKMPAIRFKGETPSGSQVDDANLALAASRPPRR